MLALVQSIPEPPVTDDINVWLLGIVFTGLAAFFYWGIRPLFKTMQQVLERLSSGEIVTADRAEERRELVRALEANTEAWKSASHLIDVLVTQERSP